MRFAVLAPPLFGVIALVSGTCWWIASGAAPGPEPHPAAAPAIERARALFLKKDKAQRTFDRSIFANDAVHRDLHDPSQALPTSHEHNADAIRAVYKFTRTCDPTTKPRDRANLDAVLTKALAWAEYRCAPGGTLPAAFFATPPFMHPSGASYVRLARATGAAPFHTAAWLIENAEYAHVTELKRWQTLLEAAAGTNSMRLYLSRLPSASLAALLTGDPDVPAGDDLIFYVRRDSEAGGGSYEVHSAIAWNNATKALPWKLEFRSPAVTCEEVAATRTCWVRKDAVQSPWPKAYGATAAVALAGLIGTLGFLAMTRLRSLARERADRLFIVRTLAHELRTPATALSLALEELRPSFSDLNPSAQDAFLRLCNASQGLSRVIATSGRYLKARASGGGSTPKDRLAAIERRAVPSVRALVEAVAEPWANRISIQPPSEDWQWRTDPAWFSLCASNLLDNACRHGRLPVTITWERVKGDLLVRVIDSGTGMPSTLDRVTKAADRGRSNRSQDDAETLGLGLAIVQRAARALGGTLEYSHHPTTTFTLRFPENS